MLLRPTLRPLFHPQTNPFSTLTRLRPQQPLRAAAIKLASRPSSSLFFRRTKPILIIFGLTIPFLAYPSSHTSFDVSPNLGNPNHPTTSTNPPPTTSSNRILTPSIVRQISLGSILGLGAGLLISTFSRSLTLILGIGIVVWQYAARQGFNIIPVERIQQSVKSVNVRRWLGGENAVMKIAFGAVCALSSFGEF